MGELYNPFPKLPKNIRQIGEKDTVVRLYLEDYVNTYLKRLYPVAGQDLRVGLLLGSIEMNDGTPYLFIDGALEMEDVTEEGCRVAFSELAWKKAYQNMEQLFPKRSVQGWFLCGAPGCDLTPLNYWKQHVQYFQGPNKMMYLNCGTEGEESIYITSEDGFYKLKGYNIYYERNQMMQDYMVLRKDVKRIEAGADDTVIREFRKRMDEHRDVRTERRQTLGLMRGMTTAMAVVILAGGIVMFNNYQKMKEMESVIASALPERAESVLMGETRTAGRETNANSSVIIEEVEDGLDSSTDTSTDTGKSLTEMVPGSGSSQGGTSQNSSQSESSQNISQAGISQSSESGGNTGSIGSGTNGSPQSTEESGSSDSGSSDSGSTQSGATQAKPPVKPTSIPAGARIHVIQDGETLYGICLAEYQDLSHLKEICEINGLVDENTIVSGQELILP